METKQITVTLAELTEAIHYSMCDVSHHDKANPTGCHNQRKYEMIAESVWYKLQRMQGAITKL